MDGYVYECPYCKELHDAEFTDCRFEGGSYFETKKETPLVGVYSDGGRKKAGFKTKNVDDCAARAISLALGQTYKKTWDELNNLLKNYSPDTAIKDSIIKNYLKSKGWAYIKTPNTKMIKEHISSKIAILKVKKHMVCVSNQTFFDTWDCCNNGKTKVFGIYLKESNKK